MNDIEWALTKLEEWIDDNKDKQCILIESPYSLWISVESLKEQIRKLKEASN